MRVSATMSHWLTGQRVPPALPGDLGSEPPLAVCRPEQLVDVGDGGLQLDDKEGLGRFMPGEDVDHATLPVDREGHLRGEHPLGELGREPPRDQLVQLGVAGVEQPIQVAGAPPGIDVDPDVKRRRDSPDVVQSHRADVPTLHPAHAGLRHLGLAGELLLRPALPPPNRSQRRSDPLVFHVAECRKRGLPGS